MIAATMLMTTTETAGDDDAKDGDDDAVDGKDDDVDGDVFI